MAQPNSRRQRKHVSLRLLIIGVVGLTVAASLLISGAVVAWHTVKNVEQRTNANIHAIGDVVRDSPVIRNNLLPHTPPRAKNNKIQAYTRRLQRATRVDAVVVMNQDLIRYSHPVKAQIGQSFLLRQDAAKSLHGRSHYSEKQGVLGPEFRYFAPIFNRHHQQIGIVCITVTVKTVQAEIRQALGPVFLGSLIGLVIGIAAAIALSFYLRRRLLGMEPDQIAAQVTELTALKDSMTDGLIAIDPSRRIIQLNAVATELFPALSVGATLPADLATALFSATPRNTVSVAVRNHELVVSCAPLMAGVTNLGQLALLRDRSDYERLLAQLTGTQQYIEALRAQQHEFLNKLQVISGLVELQQYDELQQFVQGVHHTYQAEFGHLNSQIKLPAVTGFLLAKNNEAQEQGKTFVVTPDSALPAVVATAPKVEPELIKVLGNLIDNAFDAVPSKTGRVEVALNYDAETPTIILSVRDNGTGIPADLQNKILAKNFSTKGPNRGFGLAFVQAVVQAHHGHLTFAANHPQGTIIRIELPIHPQPPKEAHA